MHQREHVAESAFGRGCSPLARSQSSVRANVEATVGHEVLRATSSLMGFTGAVYPVHPTAHASRRARWPSVLDVPDDIDLAVIAVPAAGGGQGRRAMCAKAIAARGARGQASPRSTKQARSTRPRSCRSRTPPRHAVLGPASMGVISTVPEVSIRVDSPGDADPRPGRRSPSQSGPLGVALLEQAHRAGVGISHFVALGNKADVSTNDFLQYWEGDESTSVMALHVASFGSHAKFTRDSRDGSRRQSRSMAVKTGGGDEDRTAGALFQSDRRDPRGTRSPQLFDVARVLDGQPLPPGDRVAVISNAYGVEVARRRRRWSAAGSAHGRLRRRLRDSPVAAGCRHGVRRRTHDRPHLQAQSMRTTTGRSGACIADGARRPQRW